MVMQAGGTSTGQGTQQAQSARQAQMARAYAYYTSEGVLAPLKRRGQGPDDTVLVAFGRLIVDKGVSYLFGPDVQSRVEEPGDELAARRTKKGRTAGKAVAPSAKQDWLDLCWTRNKRMLTLQKVAMNGGICGHAFVKILDTKPFPRVIVLDPQTVDVETDPDDCEEVERFVITTPGTQAPQRPAGDLVGDVGEEDAPRRRQIIAQSGEEDAWGQPASWTVTDQVEQQAGVWVTVEVALWDHPWPPLVHCQNLPRPNAFYGESDLSPDIIHMIDAINKNSSNHQKIVRLWAGPKVWARGMGNVSSIDLASDKATLMPSETAELRTLEMRSDLNAGRGHRDDLIDNLAWVTRVPTVAFGKPDAQGHLSGVALQIRMAPLCEKTEQKRRTYGLLVEELDRHLLELGGFGADVQTQLVWPEILPGDPLSERQVWVLDDGLGLASKRTLSESAGYDFETEQQQIEEEKKAAATLAATLMPQLPVQPGTMGTTASGDPVPPPLAIPAPKPPMPAAPRHT